MFFRQVLHGDLGCASYLIADTGAGDGAVVDPKWEIDEYLELAGRHGFRIGHVIETHNHADHVSGRSRLVEATGARVWVHRLAGATYEHSPFEDGDEIAVGSSVLLRVLHTPGHRPEHSAIVVVDRLRGDDPVAVLTGDSLFVNDALIFDTLVSRAVTYRAPSAPSLHIDFPDMPQLGIWTRPGAPYICIEPWQGTAARVGPTGEMRERPGAVVLAPGETRRFAMSVTLAAN